MELENGYTGLFAKLLHESSAYIWAFDTLAFYLLFTCLWFQQWYTVWLVGLAAALPAGHRRRFAAFFSMAALSKKFLFGPLIFWPDPKYTQPTAEILFTLSVLGLPWLYYLSKPVWRARIPPLAKPAVNES